MKNILILCILWQSVPAFSQLNPTPPVVTNVETFGYVDGVRMDSIHAEYATFEWGAERLFFNYGQPETRKKTTVTNEKGEPFLFVRHSISFTLNYLYFNGWELSKAYYSQSDRVDIFVLRKRHVMAL